jgi:16S rRNA (guanine(966)-N(2))-methyltransferase RsmD
LGDGVRGCHFLDLFAGTGQVGIEALSRGAARAVFVERNREALRTIRDNLAHTGLAGRAEVVRSDVFSYLSRQPDEFELVFVAPPQYRGLWLRTLEQLARRPEWLAAGGQAIVQMHPREFATTDLGTLVLQDRRSYGSVMLCFYDRHEPGPEGG